MNACPNCINASCDAFETDLEFAVAVAAAVDAAVRSGERAANRPESESPYKVPASVEQHLGRQA
jgi:hypothetical protein